ncbi:hypothetical protein Psch_02094 [Pelotomaculum schinkii]|uniref:ThiS family protein n=1 Tax=Pelotomaculum schinkii TaxID=78350 RepID=A0A4Y7RIG0_9FIRM|nr:hypothetical protein [Pelotomaculum schinkii]TEB08530.1 hypothetical protein Psch_02094 [Pelotomaculum schinkii]
MRVKFYANIRQVARVPFIEIDAKDISNIKLLLRYLYKEFGSEMGDVLYEKDGTISKNINILIDGRSIYDLEYEKTHLKNDMTIVLLSKTAGG